MGNVFFENLFFNLKCIAILPKRNWPFRTPISDWGGGGHFARRPCIFIASSISIIHFANPCKRQLSFWKHKMSNQRKNASRNSKIRIGPLSLSLNRVKVPSPLFFSLFARGLFPAEKREREKKYLQRLRSNINVTVNKGRSVNGIPKSVSPLSVFSLLPISTIFTALQSLFVSKGESRVLDFNSSKGVLVVECQEPSTLVELLCG